MAQWRREHHLRQREIDISDEKKEPRQIEEQELDLAVGGTLTTADSAKKRLLILTEKKSDGFTLGGGGTDLPIDLPGEELGKFR